MKRILKKIIPRPFWQFYHWFLAHLAAFVYGYPSRHMIVIGITGTAGKSTVANLICQILEEAGHRVGLTTTFNFKIAGKEFINKRKMTMLGRFSLQKFLRKMLQNRCEYAIIETTSQGVSQCRHLGINYDIGIFTNLSPEHIESHGSFEKYRQAKQKLFQHISQRCRKTIKDRIIPKVNIVNLDDKNSSYFLDFEFDKEYGYGINFKRETLNLGQNLKVIKAEDIRLNSKGSKFTVQGLGFTLNLLSKFNIYNSLSAICFVLSQGINLNICKQALSKIKTIPGRMEVMVNYPFQVIVDYAHTPDSLEKVYQTLRNQELTTNNQQLICVLGSAGGGRDKQKRPLLGAIAEKYCDKIIVTNEDPYNEDPNEIINQIVSGVKSKKFQKIINRGEAIKKALAMARKGDVVVITGKGSEPWIMGPNGQKIAWDDRKIVKEFLMDMGITCG